MTTLVSTNPADNYKEIGRVKVSTDFEIADKAEKAQKVKTYWKELGVKERVKLLEPIRDEFRDRKDEIAK